MDRVSKIKRLALKVIGRVQGVGYRACVHRSISACGASGYVRNLSDGSVEIIIEGTASQLEEAVLAAKEGSPFSEVSEIQLNQQKPTGEFNSFEIKK